MRDVRKVLTVGIGYGVLAVLTIGLLGDAPPVDNQPQGGGSGGGYAYVAPAPKPVKKPDVIHTITVPVELQLVDIDEELIISLVLAEFYRWRAV